MAGAVRQAPGGVSDSVYLDYQATTPVAPEAIAAMRPWIEDRFGNPHSPHRLGREAAAAIEVARGQVAAALGGEGGRLYFTSGATEAANWALKGAAARLPPDRRRIVTIATEHACVLDTVEWLGGRGYEVDILPVRPDGLVDLDLAGGRIDTRTGLVAAMLVNNEIGVIQPVAALAKLARANGARFFCDAVQGSAGCPSLPATATWSRSRRTRSMGPRASARCGSGTGSKSSLCCTAAGRRAASAPGRCRRLCASASARRRGWSSSRARGIANMSRCSGTRCSTASAPAGR
jgi:glutamate/tyrosine decarboxylase-like PLP-dependent enzyme